MVVEGPKKRIGGAGRKNIGIDHGATQAEKKVGAEADKQLMWARARKEWCARVPERKLGAKKNLLMVPKENILVGRGSEENKIICAERRRRKIKLHVRIKVGW